MVRENSRAEGRRHESGGLRLGFGLRGGGGRGLRWRLVEGAWEWQDEAV